MIIKNKDNYQDQIDYLSDLLERDLPEDKKSLIEREIKSLTSAEKNEDNSTAYLDGFFKSSKDWLLIHDLRLEHEGDSAQIDHVLIGRMMDMYVIDAMSFNSGVSISEDGEFSYFYQDKLFPLVSPLAQNKNDIALLDKFLLANDLLPKRLGVVLKPNYKNIVLISANAKLIKPTKGVYDCSSVMKGDKFLERFKLDVAAENLNAMANLAKVISQDSLSLFAEKLALQHKPKTINYIEKFGLDDALDTPECPRCKKPMVKRSAKKGNSIGNEFWGCSDFPKCKGVIKIEKIVAKEKPVVVAAGKTPSCPICQTEMIKRINKKGANAGVEFWGCKKFPKCRGVVNIELK